MVTRIINFIFVYGFNNDDNSSLTTSITKAVSENTKNLSTEINFLGSVIKDDINSMFSSNSTIK